MKNAYVGRTYKDAPNVDGLIFCRIRRGIKCREISTRVRITGALEYDLMGEII